MSEKTTEPATKPIESTPLQRAAGADHFYRFSEVDSESAEDETRTIQVAFSSETPVLRKAGASEEALGICKKGEKYWELLSHRSEDADFSILNTGKAAVLDEHQDSLQIGNVKRARLSKDRVGRAALCFDGLSDLSKTRYDQMKTGKRTGISFGYCQTRFIGDEGEKGGVPIKRIAFQADEISSVRNAADKDRAGVRRSADNKWSCLGCGEMFGRDDMDDNFECSACNCGRSAKEEHLHRTAESSKYGCLMAMLPGLETELVTWAKENIPAETLADDGIELETHTTVLYGFNPGFVTDKLKELLAVYPPVELTLGKLSRFECPDYDVIKFTVESADLTKLNALIASSFADGITPSKWGYNPHVTVAYVAKGTNMNLAAPQFEGKAFQVESLLYSLPNKEARETFPLGSRDRAAVDSTELVTRAAEVASVVEILPKKYMADPIVINEPKIRSEEAKKTRTALAARNKEISLCADAFIKDHGKKNSGAMSETIRGIANEFVGRDDEFSHRETVSEFKQRALEEIAKAKSEPFLMRAAMGNRIADDYSMGRAIASCVKRGSNLPDGLELEVHQEAKKRATDEYGGLGFEIQGFYVPSDASTPRFNVSRTSSGLLMKRDMQVGQFGQGGALVPTEMSPQVIEVLRNLLVLARAGCRSLSGLQGNLVFPRQTSVSAPQAVSEIGQLAASNPTFDQIEAKPRRVGNTVNYSKQLVLQAGINPDVEALIRDDNFKELALKIDALGLNGQGANSEPLGIMNTPGISSVAFAAAATYAKIVLMETLIRSANVYDPVTYISTSTARGVLRTAPATLTGSTIVSGASNAIWTGSDDNERVNGRTAFDSQQIPGDRMLVGAFQNFMHLMWGGLDIVVDNVTLADKAEIKLTINTWNDFIVRHAQAFCVSSDSAAQ